MLTDHSGGSVHQPFLTMKPHEPDMLTSLWMTHRSCFGHAWFHGCCLRPLICLCGMVPRSLIALLEQPRKELAGLGWAVFPAKTCKPAAVTHRLTSGKPQAGVVFPAECGNETESSCKTGAQLTTSYHRDKDSQVGVICALALAIVCLVYLVWGLLYYKLR